ncbi:MAG: 2-succinyl-5-enolpyruvyl-6-hydroxy-3-cyclohexene-1-carboxylic-acid synthase [Kofleriaceae bacterium]
MSAVQTLWTEVLASALADAGVRLCVVSPGSRSTPLVLALAACRRFELEVVIDERAAGFYALAAARSSGEPVALVCTSGSAVGHYLPAVIEASMANVPLLVLSADRPPELHDAGAAQTIPQARLFGEQVRSQLDLGAPVPEALALRALRRRVQQAVLAARGPVPGPVHVNVPLRKPLEPRAPVSDADRALAAEARRVSALPTSAGAPRLEAAAAELEELAAALVAEPRGWIVAGALPESFAEARPDVFALAQRLGYPIVAEVGSQLRLAPRPRGVVVLDHHDLVLAADLLGAPPPRALLLLGAEPAAAGWHAAQPALAGAARWALGERWQDASSTARVLLGAPAPALARLRAAVERAPSQTDPSFGDAYAAAEARAAAHLGEILVEHPTSEGAMIRAALEACAQFAARHGRAPRLLLGNSLPVRVVDLLAGQVPELGAAAAADAPPIPVVTQRGASGIDGLIAGAAGAAHDGRPVLALVGDVTFAHDAGSLALLAARPRPVVLVVIDNGGGRIFDHLPIGSAQLEPATYARYFTTAPGLDPVAIAHAFGVPARRADTAAGAREAIVDALSSGRAALIHVPVPADSALLVRRAALDAMQPPLPLAQGATS